MNNRFTTALGIGTGLQVLMVVVGHVVPSLQTVGLFPIVGTLIGLLTGVLAGGPDGSGARPTSALMGGVAAGVAGGIGSLVSTALGDVPLMNILIAAGSTLVMGAIGAAIRNRRTARA